MNKIFQVFRKFLAKNRTILKEILGYYLIDKNNGLRDKNLSEENKSEYEDTSAQQRGEQEEQVSKFLYWKKRAAFSN